MISIGRILLGLFLSIILLSPIAVGVFPVFPAIIVVVIFFAFSAYALRTGQSGTNSRRVATIILSVCFAITLADLISRPLLDRLEHRPRALFAHELPELPVIYRFSANVNFKGRTFGDLAAVSQKKEWREDREINFITDPYGFRNEPKTVEQPLDLIILGDSYGVGDGTSQDKTWPTLLASEHSLAVYNLSMDGAGPWQEYVNFLLAGERLKTREGTTLLWLLFTGNDLIDPCYPAFTKEELPWLGPRAKLLHRIRTFRYNSPLRRVLFRGQPSQAGDVVARALPNGQMMLFDKAYARVAAMTLDEVLHHPNYDNVKTTFAALAKLAAAKHLRLVVAVAPSKEEVYDWIFNQTPPWSSGSNVSGFSAAVRNLCDAGRIPFFDLKPGLVEAAKKSFAQSGSLLWWRDDTHWNPLGHRLAAAALYDSLLSSSVTATKTEYEQTR